MFAVHAVVGVGIERARRARVGVALQVARRHERRARCRGAECAVDHVVGGVGVHACGAGEAERPRVGEHEPPVQRELLVLVGAVGGLVAQPRHDDVERVVGCPPVDPLGEVDREPDRLGDLHVVEPHLGEPDRVGPLGLERWYRRGERPDREPVHVGVGERHDLAGRGQRLGPEVDGDRRAAVHLHRHLGEHPVTRTVLGLHERDVVGAGGAVGHQHELGAGRIGATDTPRGAQIVVEGACGAVLGAGDAAVLRRVDGAPVLLDDGARVVAGSRGTRRAGSRGRSGRAGSGRRARSRPCCRGST